MEQERQRASGRQQDEERDERARRRASVGRKENWTPHADVHAASVPEFEIKRDHGTIGEASPGGARAVDPSEFGNLHLYEDQRVAKRATWGGLSEYAPSAPRNVLRQDTPRWRKRQSEEQKPACARALTDITEQVLESDYERPLHLKQAPAGIPYTRPSDGFVTPPTRKERALSWVTSSDEESSSGSSYYSTSSGDGDGGGPRRRTKKKTKKQRRKSRRAKRALQKRKAKVDKQPRLKNLVVPKFSGAATEQVEMFLKQFHQAELLDTELQLSKWTDGLRAQILPTFLTGEASTWYIQESMEHGPLTWTVLVERLTLRFRSKKPEAAWIKELLARQKHTEESFSQYAAALRLMAHYIRGGLRESLVADAFSEGVPEPCRSHLLSQKHQIVGEAVAQAEIIARGDGLGLGVPKRSVKATALATTPTNPTPATPEKCRRCKKSDHRRPDCPLDPWKCFNCDKPGHLARACPLPMTAEREARRKEMAAKSTPTPAPAAKPAGKE